MKVALVGQQVYLSALLILFQTYLLSILFFNRCIFVTLIITCFSSQFRATGIFSTNGYVYMYRRSFTGEPIYRLAY